MKSCDLLKEHMPMYTTFGSLATLDFQEEFRRHFDAVVMLTWSHWKTEPRSNRYHYASRFASMVPVYFVQEDSPNEDCHLELTSDPNLTLINAPLASLGWEKQARQLTKVLRDRGVTRPLLWMYNVHFHHFATQYHAPLKVYHATEDYFSKDMFNKVDREFLDELRRSVAACQALVTVSEALERRYARFGFSGNSMVATNGCDYNFYAAEKPEAGDPEGPPVAIYSGGINFRLDFPLLTELVNRLPGWRFQFCGKVGFTSDHARDQQLWENLLQRPNVQYLGFLPPEAIRAAQHRATVGLIPFRPLPAIVKRSFPLKGFEYVACGLPVVGIPIDVFQQWPELFSFAETAKEFAAEITKAARWRHDPTLLRQRRAAARDQSYDEKFAHVCRFLLKTRQDMDPVPEGEQVLVLIDRERALEPATQKQLLQFRDELAPCTVHFAPATEDEDCRYSLLTFDTIILHSSLTVDGAGTLAPAFRTALRESPARKLLLVDDTLGLTPDIRRAQRELGLHDIYSDRTPPRQLVRPGPLAFLPRPSICHWLNAPVPRPKVREQPPVAPSQPAPPPPPVGLLRKTWRRMPGPVRMIFSPVLRLVRRLAA